MADVETVFDIERGHFNDLFATATPLFVETDDAGSFPNLKRPALQPFLVKNIFTDFKRHDLGSNFWERNYFGYAWPALRPFLTNDFVRGAISGLGVLNLVAGFAELAPVFTPRDRHDLVL